MLETITQQCQFLLNNFPDAQASKSYLNSRLQPSTQQQWGFGYFPNTTNLPVLLDLVGEETLIKQDLLSLTSPPSKRVVKNFFEDHPLIMPQRDTYGNIIALIGRTLLPEPIRQSKNIIKYKNTSFKKGHYLFGLYENKQAILDQGFVFVVEGQLDVIKASEIGLNNTVALGTNSLSIWQYCLISRYCNNIHLLLDNDEPGQKGRKRIISMFGKNGNVNIRNFYIPDIYKDIDEYILNGNIKDHTELSFTTD
jgi:DNA primase